MGLDVSSTRRAADHHIQFRFVAQAWKDPQNITDQLSPKPEKPQ
jgi:hypothetical protein